MNSQNKSFTLIELLIASSIFMVVMLTVQISFNTGIFGYRNIEGTLTVAQAATKVFERMNLDLRNSFAYSTDETKFSGGKNEISFLTLAQDYAFISYKLEENNLLRLCRRNQESLDDKIEIKPKILASNLKEIVFSYGFLDTKKQILEWKDAWDDPVLLPAAVKVNLTIKNEIGRTNAEQNFERIIFLPAG